MVAASLACGDTYGVSCSKANPVQVTNNQKQAPCKAEGGKDDGEAVLRETETVRQIL